MTSSLRTVIVDSDADSTAALKRILAANPSVVLVGEFVNARQAAHEAPARRPDLVIVEVDETGPTSVAELPAWVIGSLTRALPGAAIFATGRSVSADLVIEVIRAGALEFIRQPVEREDLISALEKVVRLPEGHRRAVSRDASLRSSPLRVVSVSGPWRRTSRFDLPSARREAPSWSISTPASQTSRPSSTSGRRTRSSMHWKTSSVSMSRFSAVSSPSIRAVSRSCPARREWSAATWPPSRYRPDWT